MKAEEQNCYTIHWVCLILAVAVLVLHQYFEVHNLLTRTDYNALKWILNLAGGNLVHWWLRLLHIELPIVHRSGIKNQVAYALLRLDKGVTNTAKLDGDLPEMMVSLIENKRKINDDHDRKCDLQGIFQLCDDSRGTGNSALLEVATITNATIMHMATEETPSLRGFLHAQALDHE